MIFDKTRRKVYFNKTTAVVWVIAGILAFVLGIEESVALVWIASVYANAKTDWSTAEAADDRELKALLAELLEAVQDGNSRHDSCDCRSGLFPGGDGTDPDTSESGSTGFVPGVAGGTS